MVESKGAEDYNQLKKLGEGWHGTAWLVERQRDKKWLVIKTVYLKNFSEEERRCKEQEARLLEKMDHPNILAFVDAFKKNDNLCIVMEYVDAGDLNSKIKERAKTNDYFSTAQILDIFT